MRILVIGRSRRLSAESAVYRALVRRGHTVALVDDRRLRHWVGRRAAHAWLRARVRAFRPALLLMGKPLDVDVPVLTELCARVPAVLWYRDLRVPAREDIVERARCAGLVFLTPGGQVAEFEARGVRRALYLPDAVDPWLDRPAPAHPEMVCDVAFVGSGYDAYRAEFLARLGRRHHVRVWGPRWERWRGTLDWTGRPAFGRDFARVCASARVVLGINPSFQVDSQVWGYASNRMWKILACGGFYLGNATPGMRELLRDGEHCAWYDDEDHALEQIDRYLGDDAARHRIAAAGRAFALAHHTFDRRVENLLAGSPFRNPLLEPAAAGGRPPPEGGAGADASARGVGD